MTAARKCSQIRWNGNHLTKRHIVLLTMLAEHSAMTSEHLTAFLFGSPRRCQANMAYLKGAGLVRELSGLPRPAVGSPRRLYALTADGARVVSGSGPEAWALRKRVRRVGGSGLHLRHTVAVNDFFTKLHVAAGADGGHLQWFGEAACHVYYEDARSGRPQLTPDGAGTLRLGAVETRFFLELDRGTERQQWLLGKYRRDLRRFAGRIGAETIHVLFAVPNGRREWVIHNVGQAALRGSVRPHPEFWTANQRDLGALGPLGAVWARVPGGWGTRARLSEMGQGGQPPPSLWLPASEAATDMGVAA